MDYSSTASGPPSLTREGLEFSERAVEGCINPIPHANLSLIIFWGGGTQKIARAIL